MTGNITSSGPLTTMFQRYLEYVESCDLQHSGHLEYPAWLEFIIINKDKELDRFRAGGLIFEGGPYKLTDKDKNGVQSIVDDEGYEVVRVRGSNGKDVLIAINSHDAMIAELAALRARIRTLEEVAGERLAVLREVEWVVRGKRCMFCGGWKAESGKGEGHLAGCRLAAALREKKGSDETQSQS